MSSPNQRRDARLGGQLHQHVAVAAAKVQHPCRGAGAHRAMHAAMRSVCNGPVMPWASAGRCSSATSLAGTAQRQPHAAAMW